MDAMGGRHVVDAVAEMVRVLGPHTSRDWYVRAGSLTWTCWTTAAHVAHDLLAYAGQLAARPTSAYLPFDLRIRPDTPPRDVLQVAVACGGLLSGALTAATLETRAWHFGPCDPTAFAAMGVAETLLHTYDITQGLDIPWLPPEHLCAAALNRLKPDAPPGNPAQVLLWCTGRAELDGRSPVTAWVWDPAVR